MVQDQELWHKWVTNLIVLLSTQQYKYHSVIKRNDLQVHFLTPPNSLCRVRETSISCTKRILTFNKFSSLCLWTQLCQMSRILIKTSVHQELTNAIFLIGIFVTTNSLQETILSVKENWCEVTKITNNTHSITKELHWMTLTLSSTMQYQQIRLLNMY